MSFYLFFRHLNVQKCSTMRCCQHSSLRNVLGAKAASPFSTSQMIKALRAHGVLSILTSKCASCLFVPQQRALAHTFSSAQLPKVFRNSVFVAFWVWNVLHAAVAFTVSTSQLLKMLQECGAFSILTSKSGSRHNGVQFLISPHTRWLRTPAALPSLLRNIGKT